MKMTTMLVARPLPVDWNSVTLTKTDAVDEDTDTVVLYTDIAAPADKLLTVQYLPTVLDDALLMGTVGKVASSGFPSTPDTDWEYTGLEDGRAITVAGTFDGVPGNYVCTVTPCEVMTDAKGKLLPSENWRFTPMSPLTATVKVPDANYAYFGWWLNKPKDNTGSHTVEVFAGAVGGDAVGGDAVKSAMPLRARQLMRVRQLASM